MFRRLCLALALAATTAACATTDLSHAYRGVEFSKTGLFALYIGGKGFTGPVLNPGSYFTGLYNHIVAVDCAVETVREPLTALTKDGVQFGVDIYVRYAVECSDDSVKTIVQQIRPQADDVVTAQQMYSTFVRPAVAAAVREVVSPYRANDLNERREELLDGIRKKVLALIDARERKFIHVQEVNLSNLDFPDAMDAANVDRAVQAVMRDKAIAERERVTAEIETAKMRLELSTREGEVEAARIDKIGAALHRNPEYLQFDLQQKMPGIYQTAGQQGNLVIAAPEPGIHFEQRRQQGTVPPPPKVADPITGHGPPSARDNPLDRHGRPAGREP